VDGDNAALYLWMPDPLEDIHIEEDLVFKFVDKGSQSGACFFKLLRVRKKR